MHLWELKVVQKWKLFQADMQTYMWAEEQNIRKGKIS